VAERRRNEVGAEHRWSQLTDGLERDINDGCERCRLMPPTWMQRGVLTGAGVASALRLAGDFCIKLSRLTIDPDYVCSSMSSY
jgi:hypothetical protein